MHGLINTQSLPVKGNMAVGLVLTYFTILFKDSKIEYHARLSDSFSILISIFLDFANPIYPYKDKLNPTFLDIQ